MKIKLSKSQWELISKKTGWIKKAQDFQEKMMPGQTPYTNDESKKLHKMVEDAAIGDPGEIQEQDDNIF